MSRILFIGLLCFTAPTVLHGLSDGSKTESFKDSYEFSESGHHWVSMLERFMEMFGLGDELPLSTLFGPVTEFLGVDVTKPREVCEGFVEMLSDKDAPMNMFIDKMANTSKRLLADVGAELCDWYDMSDSEMSEDSKHYMSDDSKGYKFTFSEGMEFDYEHIMRVILSKIGGYNDTDKLCHNMTEALAEDEDPALMDEIASNMMMKFMDVVEMQDMCSLVLNEINDELHGIMDLNQLGFGSMDDFCAELTSASNHGSSLEFDLPSVGMSDSDWRDEMLPGLVLLNALRMGKNMLNAENMLDGAFVLCDTVGEMLGNDDEVGEMIKGMCDLLETGDMDSVADRCEAMILEHIANIWWPHDIESGWLDWFPFGALIDTFSNMVGFDVTSPVILCPAVGHILTDKQASISRYLDKFLDFGLSSQLQLGGVLCREGLGSESTSDKSTESLFESFAHSDEIDYGYIMGVVYSAIGGYDDSDALCVDVIEATEHDANSSLAEGMVEHFKDRIMGILHVQDTCSSVLEQINMGFGGMLDVGEIGFASFEELCEVLSSAANADSSMGFEISSLDMPMSSHKDMPKSMGSHKDMSESMWSHKEMFDSAWEIAPGLKMFDLIKVGGRILNIDNVFDGAVLFCEAFGDMFGEFDEDGKLVAAMCGLIKSDRMHDFTRECRKLAGDDEDDDEDDMLGWLFDWLPFDTILDTISSFLGMDMTDADIVCPAILHLLSDRQASMAQYLDKILDHILVTDIHVGAVLCQGFNESDSYSHDMASLSESFAGEGEIDYGYIMGVIFTALGDYEDTAQLCLDVTEAAEAGEDSSLVEGMVEHFKTRIMGVLQNPDTCSSVLNEINEGFGGMLDVSSLGLDSLDELCSVMTSATDPGSSFDMDMSSMGKSQFSHADMFESAGMIFPGFAFVDAIKVAGHMLHVESVYDGAVIVCEVFGEILSMEELGGEMVGEVCKLMRSDSMHLLMGQCEEMMEKGGDNETLGWIDEIFDALPFDMTMIQTLFGAVTDIMAIDFAQLESLSIEAIFEMISGMIGFDIIDPEMICPLVSVYVADLRTPIHVYVETALNYGIAANMHIGAVLCQGNEESYSEGPADHSESTMEEEFDFANIMGVVFTAIGGYSDVEELCLNTLQATAEDADAEFVDMVVHLKTRIMGVLSSQETCASVLNGLNDGFDGMLDVTVLGFSSMDELCAELTSALEFDSASDTLVENSESSQMEEFTIGDAFKIVGLLSSAETLYDGALIYCSIMREISEDQVIGSICGVIESDLVAGLMHQCSEMVEDDSESIEWPDVGDVVWLDDVIPIQDIFHTVMGVMNFNFESVDSSLVCPAVQMLSQEGTSIGGMLPHFFDQLMMLNMHMGAFLCQNKDAGGEFGQMVGVVLSAVAGYDDADQLCIDLAEAMSEDADPSMAEEMSSRLEMRIKSLLLDESTCVSALVEIDDGLGGMLDLSVLGFASVDDFCATMTSITDIVFEFDAGSEIWSSETKSETKSERMMPSEWMPSEMTAADVMSLGARFLHVDSVYSGAVLVCDMLPYMMDSSFEIIGGMCDMLMSDEMTTLIEECHEGPSIPEWWLENGGMDWAEDLLSLDSLFGAVTDFLGLNTTDAEEICNTLIGILSDRQTPLAVYLDTALDHVLLENLYMGAYLCADDEDQQSNDDKSERSDWFGKSSDGMDGYSEWSDDNGDDMYGRIMGVVFTALGGYNDTDGLCRDVLAVTADGVDSSLVSGMVSHVKSRIMAVLQLKETCVSVLSQINDEFGGLLSLGLIEFGSIDGFCSELTTAMDPESSFQLDIESFDWPSVPMSEFFQRPSALLSGISITDALGVVGQILNAGSLYDGSLILCSTVGHMFGVDESAGAGGLFRDVCQLLENDDMDTLSQECVDLILAEFPSEFLLEQSEIEVCFGIPDCLGVCNGDATADCAGVCNGNGTLDCALRCNGDAYINECSECVGGTTGRSTDFGIDKCGYCKKVRGYRITWDCYGTCNGTASFDKCGECVGGETGLEDNANDGRLDCRDICDGGWILDDCGYCEPSDGSNSTASKYMDCSGTCVLPGFDRAYENECGICVGGNTNLTDDEGKNDCGCNGVVSATSCLGCDGVANSGKTYDACGVCGGTGTDCVGVGWVVPNFIPADTQIELTIIGAGFTQGSTLSCIFEATDGTQTETQMIVYNSTTVITCMSPALAMDNYTITIRRDSDQPTDIGASLYTYQDVNITSIDPVEIVLDSSVTSLTITATAEAGAFSDIRNLPYAVPTLILAGTIFADGQGSYEGQFVSDTEIEFEVETPSVSCRVYGTPTVNGYTGLGTTKVSPVTMTAYAAAPNMESAQFSNNGAGILVTFDTGVQYKDFTSCSDIFDDASNALLGVGSECFFRDPKRLIIVIGKAVTLIEPGDALTLRSGAVKTFHQDYSHDASGNITVAGPQQALQPTALLDGAPKIPSCGNVRISGRRSTGSGARTMTYTWDVQSEGNMTNVTAALSGLNSPDLELDGEVIDADTPYNFSLTVTNFLGESDIAYYVVERSAVALPQIKVVSKGVDVSSASVSDSFDLTAEVTFYSECVPPGTTQFSWSVDNSDVPLNLKTMYKRTLYVDANSLPGDQVITFTVQVHKDSDPDKVATASIQVATVSTPLVATIRGGAEITVGRDSGDVEIDGSSSEDPDNVAVDMSYEWTCTQVTDNAACYSYKSGEEGQLFPATTDSAILVFDALSMGADKTYEFTLTISKLTREASASVRVSAVSGNPPQVSVEIENSDENKVTEDEIVTIRSLVKHTVPLVSVVFESVDTDTGYGYFNFSDLNGLVTVPKIHSSPDGTRSLANVILKAGQLVKGTSYSVQVTATDEDGQSSSSKVSFSVRSGVTSCDFIVAGGVSSYTEMEEISYLVENCVADEDAYPLSYQIFRIKDHDNKMEAITTKGSEPSSTGVGKSARDGTSNNTFVAKVCDKFSCAEFSVDIDVDVKVSFSATDIADFRTNQIEPLEYQGAYLEALVNTNMLLVKTASSSRRRKRSYADTTTADEQGRLDLIQNVLSSTVLSEDDAPLLIDQIGNFITSDMAIGDQDTFLDIMKEVVTIYSSDADTVIDTENARILLEKLHDIGSGMDPVWNSAMLDKCRKGQARMLKSLSRGQTLGGGATQIASSGVTVSIEKNVLDGSFSSAGGATIDFGSELQNMYTAAWSCDSGTCSGVSVKTQHYDTGVDYRSTTDEDKNSRAADVISVELSDPESDETLNITDLATPIKMNLTINSPDGTKLYTCMYWDEDTGAWSTDGVTTVEIDSSTVECQMNHLSEFSAFSSDPPSTVLPSTAAVTVPASTESLTTLAVAAPLDSTGDNTGIIIGAVVGAIAVIVVAVIIAIVMIKKAKKPAKNIEDGRSDTDTVSPRKIDHVRVETKTPEAKTPRSTATNDPTYAAVSGLSPAYPPNDPYSSVTKAEIAAFSAHTSSSNNSTSAATANQKAQLAETLPTMDEFLASQGATTKKEPTYEGSLFKEPTVVSEAGKTDATTFRAKSVTKARPGSGLTVVSVDGISEDSALPESRPSSTSRSTSVTTHHM